MKRSDHEDLFKRYQSGEATPEEQAIVEDYILNNELNPLYLSEEELEEMTARLGSRIGKIPFTEKPAVPLYRRWKIAVGIAAAVALIVLGVYFFNTPYRHLDDRRDLLTSANDIAPGKNGATLTLANGKVIQLSDAKSGVVIGNDKLAYNDGEILRDALDDKKGEDAVASTAKGQTYIFTLPDGTKVWLNAASKLSIPLGFSGTETRKVELTGEAYFEVAKNKKRPFIVESNGQEVTVLGTHFNINSYGDEGMTKTTLLEGSVSVRHAVNTPRHPELVSGSRNRKTILQGRDPDLLQDDDRFRKGEAIILKPNQQSTLTATNKIQVTEVNPAQAIAWKNGDFSFSDQPITLVMKAIERWYDVEVVYEGAVPDINVNASISRNRNISQVLKMMEKTREVKFRIAGKKVFVSK